MVNIRCGEVQVFLMDYPRCKYILRLNISETVKLQTVLDLQILHDIKQVINFICS